MYLNVYKVIILQSYVILSSVIIITVHSSAIQNNITKIYYILQMTVEYKWQVILTDSCYTDFNMWVPLGCNIASRMFDLLRKRKALCRGD